MTVHTRRGKFFDELVIGDVYVHRPGRTVTEADNLLFTTLTMNTQSLHLDAAFAETREFGQRLVNSLFTMSTVVGLSVADLTEGTTVANLGFSEIAFASPVFIGDTVTAETEVLAKRESSSRPGQGIVTFEHRGHNQRGELVCTARRAALVLAASAAEALDVDVR
ncbi:MULTISPECIES: MaoC family dehydratase [unclassified Rhodococcus (in: high G+C Gram-positive bacteria)]|jgi:acyl dehydratase|uniref:MaoC family dehydratase n=1 Tax=unclassified Rhodococcus (in: high G+C Gram-positive bacteria) TaxID=192944 RepID=UPI0003112F31|nr:MaoC family dehydratase [Rhodococcus sp. DK17]